MNVCVIGGGAAGMLAALTAAENGHRVLLLERQSRVGRKLLATGNGRCNLSNYHVSPAHYHGGAGFCDFALSQFDVGETLQYFASLGLLTVSEASGRIYPMSNMAGSVLDVLRYALERPEIDLQTSQTVTAVRKMPEGFSVKTETDTFSARCLILAAGGAPRPHRGGGRGGGCRGPHPGPPPPATRGGGAAPFLSAPGGGPRPGGGGGGAPRASTHCRFDTGGKQYE